MILHGIHYSPWSLRAKWALRHHAIAFEYREYVPMVSTPILRIKARDFSGPITVPILIDGATILRDSVDIAKFADERGSGSPLFSDSEDAVNAWTATADQIAESGRAITTFEVTNDRDAAIENIPRAIPRAIRPLSIPIVTLGARYLAAKYGFSETENEEAHTQMRAALERVANRLGSSETLGETFGWPDIALVAALQFVRPAEQWVRLGAASRACWTRPQLSEEFADVLSWRDRTLSTHSTAAP